MALQKSESSGVTMTSAKPAPACKKLELRPRKNKHKRRPPRGMYMTQADLLALATGPPTQGEVLLKQLQCELVALRQQVQNNKQVISGLRSKAVGGVDSFRPPEVSVATCPTLYNVVFA